ncbi:unnamed protein product [Brassica rapa subsp. trilocularis]
MNQNERLSAELATQKNSVTQRSNKTGTTTTNRVLQREMNKTTRGS